MPLRVAASAWTEILRAPEKDLLVSKNANVSEESALFSERIGENPIFLARLIPLLGQFLNEQEIPLFRFIPQWREKEWERAREGGRGYSGEMFLPRVIILQADSHDVSLVKNIIVPNLNEIDIHNTPGTHNWHVPH